MMKQQINHGVIQKVRHLHNVIFYFINLCHSLSFYSITTPVLFTNKLWNEKKNFCIYGCFRVQRIISKDVEDCMFRHDRIFRYTCMYKQPILTN